MKLLTREPLARMRYRSYVESLHPRRPTERSRPALALVVAVLCLLTGVALVALAGGAGPEPARAQRAAEIPSDVMPGHPHAGDLGVPGMSERELRAYETATLGAAHAREHALMRRAIRTDKAGGDAVSADAAAPKLAAAADVVEDVGPAVDVGQWKPGKTPFPIVAIHAALLPTGKVMFFSYPTFPNRPNSAEAYLWDPATPNVPPVLKNPPDKANIWCAGQTFTADGELVVFGGNLDYESPSQTWKGLDRVFTFNPWSETWTEQPRMAHGRWYPTGVRRPDGRIPIISGLDESGVLIPHSNTNQDIELFTPGAGLSQTGSIKKVGEIGSGDLDERTKKPIGGLYPRMISMASGHTILAGPDRETSWYIDTADPFTWGDIPNLNRHRTWGTTVPLPSGPNGPTQLMAIGGTEWNGEGSTTTTELFDENGGAWQPQTGKDNLYGRGHANTVLLPDGSMLEVGGGRGSLDSFESPLHYAEPEKRHVELWDPDTGEWRLGPAQTEARAYHSTALLLPDASVMSAGDDYNGDPGKVDANNDSDPMEDTAEIYQPPYLFRDTQPSVGSVATSTGATDGTPSNHALIGFDGSFGVNTTETNIVSAALAAPGAVTHGVDMNQRMLELPVTQRSGCVSVTAPRDPNAAPPGYYMLFLINDQGVPSKARWVKLVDGGPLGGCGTAPPPDTADPTITLDEPQSGTVGGTIDLRATAHDDRGVVRVEFRREGGVLLASDSTSPYWTTWNTISVPDGAHTITATAFDAAGKTASASALLNVQNTDVAGPTVSITSPGQSAPVTGDTPITATAIDPSGVKDVQFKVDGANVGPADTTAPYSTLWSSINVPNGAHTLTAVARDMRLNASPSQAVVVNVNNQDGQPVNSLPPKKTPQNPGGGGGTSGAGGGGGNPASPNPAPVLSRLKLSQATFRKGKPTTISFRLSEAGKVALSFERKLDGRRVRGRCVKPATGLRPNCTRYSRLKTGLTVQGKAGTNTVVFRGRLSRSKVLAVGRYRLTLVATDSTGKKSSARQVGFRMLDSVSVAQARAVRAVVLGWL
jgi:hypothetical protein